MFLKMFVVYKAGDMASILFFFFFLSLSFSPSLSLSHATGRVMSFRVITLRNLLYLLIFNDTIKGNFKDSTEKTARNANLRL
jgi:hypothetical protein